MLNFRQLSLACVIFVAACDAPKETGTVATLQVEFSWSNTSGCFDPKSPAFTIGGAPEGTKFLQFKMTDLNVRSFNHGGGTVEYSGPDIPQGAFSYKGPCPPSGSHDYRWDVTALNAAKDTVLARGSKTLPYSQ